MRIGDMLTAALLVIASFAFLMSFDPLARPVLLDPATWDYMSLELTRGLVPYRDIFLHKTPGGAFVGAIGAWAGPRLDLSPVQGVHTVYLLLASVGPGLLYLLCRHSSSVGAALTAALWMMAIDEWPVAALEGARPKIPTVVFGLACLLAAERRRYAWAGLAGAVSTLCWQPGCAFLVGAAAVCFEQRSTRRHWQHLVVGTSAPVVLMLGWLAWHGALGDLWEQAVVFNTDYIATKARTVEQTIAVMYRLIRHWNEVELLVLPLAVTGLRLSPERFPRSLTVVGTVYVLMCFVSFQAWPDIIPLTPWVAALCGTGLYGLARSVLPPRRASVAPMLAAIIAAAPTAPRLWTPLTYAQQGRSFAGLAPELRRQDKVVVVSVPEFLIHRGRRNAWKWPYLWFGIDRFAAHHTAGGFAGVLEELERMRPALILVGRRWHGPLRAQFEDWTATKYARHEVEIFPHLARPIAVYRHRRAGKAQY